LKGKYILGTFSKRFPARDEILNGLAACMLPVFIWSIINVLREIPGWIMRMSTWDLVGAIAYTQAFALIESVIIFLLILILGLIMPERYFRNKFLALTATIVSVSTFWVILAHYNDEIIRTWGIKHLLVWGVIFGSTLFLFYLLVQRFDKVEAAVVAVIERVNILSFFYMFVGVMALIIVLIRNIVGVL
jgi:hypothetical protein